MALRDWLSGSGGIATANIAKIATDCPPPEEGDSSISHEVTDNKVGSNFQQSENTSPDNQGISEDSFLAPEVCADCKRFEVVYFTIGRDKTVPGCLYPADGSYPIGWRRLPDGLKECMWEKQSQSLSH